MIKCEKTNKNLGIAEIRGTVKEILVEFSAVSQSIADVMMKNEFSEEEVKKALTDCINHGIKEAYELYNH